MALSAIITEVANALAGLGIDSVLTAPPVALTEQTTAFCYEQLGSTSPISHTTYQHADTVIVEYHRMIGTDPSSVVTDTRDLVDAMRLALLQAYGHRFAGQVMSMGEIAADGPLPMEYGATVTFGFRLRIPLMHLTSLA